MSRGQRKTENPKFEVTKMAIFVQKLIVQNIDAILLTVIESI